MNLTWCSMNDIFPSKSNQSLYENLILCRGQNVFANDKCPLCFKNFNEDEHTARHIDCGWVFHQKCLLKWSLDNKTWFCPIDQNPMASCVEEVSLLAFSKSPQELKQSEWSQIWREMLFSSPTSQAGSAELVLMPQISMEEFLPSYLVLCGRHHELLLSKRMDCDSEGQHHQSMLLWKEANHFVSRVTSLYYRLLPIMGLWLSQDRSFVHSLFEIQLGCGGKGSYTNLFSKVVSEHRGFHNTTASNDKELEKTFRMYCESNDRARGVLISQTSAEDAERKHE